MAGDAVKQIDLMELYWNCFQIVPRAINRQFD